MALGTTGQTFPGTQNPQAILLQADQLRQAGRMAEAETLVRNLVAKMPDLTSALNMLSLLLRARGEFPEAETLMRRAVQSAPREPALHNNLGNILLARGDAAGAEAAYRKAVSLKSDYPEALCNLGIALRELGRPEEALVAVRRADQLRPGYAAALVQVGVLLSEAGKLEEALGPLEAAVTADPGYYDARYYLGAVLIGLERFQLAIPVLQQAVDIAPRRHEARYAVSKAFAHVGREADALRGFQTAFEAKPDYLPALYDFTALAWTLGNGLDSLKSYAYARSKAGDTPDLLLAEAQMRLRFFDEAAAETLLRDAQEKAPERADIANTLGRALAQKSRFDESFPQFQRAIAAAPHDASYRRDFAEALLRGRHMEQARSVLAETLALSPYDQIALGLQSLVLRELGDSAYDTLVDHDRFVREYEIAPPSGFASIADFNRALAEELDRLHTRRAAPIDQTLQNGTQTAGSLFSYRSRAIEQLRDQIHAAVADYIRAMPQDGDHPFLARRDETFSFAGSWSCRLNAAGYHTNHVHDQGWISSAYYAALPEIVAEGSHGQGALKFGESRFGLGENDRASRLVKPAVGKLVLFPSYYWHGTVPFESDRARLTVAFDVTPGKPVRQTPFVANR